MIHRRKKLIFYYPCQEEPRLGAPASKDLLPLALLQIASLPHRDGYAIEIIDANLFAEPATAHRRVVEACEDALLFATTGILGYQVADGIACARAVAERLPDLPRFLGGWWASSVPELELATGLWDAVAIGQGEITFHELVQAVEAGTPLDDVAGLALVRDGQVVRTPPRRIVGWGELPDCPWDLIDLAEYRDQQLDARAPRESSRMMAPPGYNGKPFWGITYFSSFGCPEPCTFCCSPEMTGLRWKAMPAERMVDDLCALHERWGFQTVRFFDANWGVAEKRVKGFCDGLVARGSPFWWTSMLQAFSILRYKPETLDAMRDAGLYHVVIGGETGDDEMLTAVGKHTRTGDNLHAAQEMDRRGICSLMTYILGYPGETTAQMLATLDECREIAAACPLARPVAWPFRPIPGSALYPRALELGFRPPERIEGWGLHGEYHLHELESWPGQLPAEVVQARALYEHFFSLALGLARGHIGWWERRAQRRMRTGDFRLGRLEAKAFHVSERWLRGFGPAREREIHPGVQTSVLTGRATS